MIIIYFILFLYYLWFFLILFYFYIFYLILLYLYFSFYLLYYSFIFSLLIFLVYGLFEQFLLPCWEVIIALIRIEIDFIFFVLSLYLSFRGFSGCHVQLFELMLYSLISNNSVLLLRNVVFLVLGYFCLIIHLSC